MEDIDEDPLDLLEDDGDGVIETILMEEEDKKPVRTGTGCVVLLLVIGSPFGAGLWLVTHYLA